MSSTRKLFLCPWFGPLPEWWGLYRPPAGYDFLLFTDRDGFDGRCRERLGVGYPDVVAPHGFRPALGVLFAEEIAGYDFWGHTDLDCVYGRVGRWVTDEFLEGLDVHSNHRDYVCGPWTLYRNRSVVNELFMRTPGWRDLMVSSPGWAEVEFTRTLDDAHGAGDVCRLYSHWQVRDQNDLSGVRFDGDRLLDGDEEIFMAHFNRHKVYPEGCK